MRLLERLGCISLTVPRRILRLGATDFMCMNQKRLERIFPMGLIQSRVCTAAPHASDCVTGALCIQVYPLALLRCDSTQTFYPLSARSLSCASSNKSTNMACTHRWIGRLRCTHHPARVKKHESSAVGYISRTSHVGDVNLGVISERFFTNHFLRAGQVGWSERISLG